MKKFDGYYLFSDMDGTLVTGKYEIPPQNIEALNYFTVHGGRFALATGRGLHPSTLKLVKQLPINLPCVLLNGGLIYDFEKEEMLYNAVLPSNARPLVETLLKRYPQRSISVWCPDYRVELGVRADWMLPCPRGDIDSITDPWCKLVINNEPSEQQGVLDFIEQHITSGMYATISCDSFIEVMPNGVSKGSAVETLIESMALDRSHVLTIGDYYNDVELLSIRGVRSFCPQNTPDDIKALCERSFCHVDDAAIADLISFLESH